MKRMISLLCAVSLLLTATVGCMEYSAPGDYAVYCCVAEPKGGEDAVCAVASSAAEETEELLAMALLQELCAMDHDRYRSPLPKDTKVLGVTIENGIAEVNFSEEYARLFDMELTLANSCVALTLCQIAGVDRVRILVGGKPPTHGESLLSGDQMLLRSMDQENRRLQLRLFYPSKATGELVPERYVMELQEGESRVAAVIAALQEKPKDPELLAVLPKGAAVVASRVEEGICYVTLSKNFLEDIPKTLHEQENVIYSVVKSLCSVNDIQAVQITVEGETRAIYGQIDLRSALS